MNLKVEGKEITTAAPPAQRAQVIDLMDALKQSLAKRVPQEKKAAKARRAEIITERKARASKK